MVAIIHKNGWAVANVSKFDTSFNGKVMFGILIADNLYQEGELLKEGDEVECYTKKRQVTGIVTKVGSVHTTIRIVAETLGIENKLIDIING